ncbi:MAG: hypothetical protein IT320_16730 [Anaerolineae bacterium]|nr:hypothetical protein [Anaerolineae bacterium]
MKRAARLRTPALPDHRSVVHVSLIVAIALCLLSVSSSFGQATPAVSIGLSERTAHEGETILAHVYISGVNNLAEADVGIAVDERCLRIVDRFTGTLLPDTGGGVTALSTGDEHETRLGVAVTDRSMLANGGGIFYSVQVHVVCTSGAAPIEITYAELSAYPDGDADPAEPRTYTMADGTLTIASAQLQIGPVEEQTPLPPTPTPLPTPTLDPVTVETEQAMTRSLSTLNIALYVLLAVMGVCLVLLFLWLARRVIGRFYH